MRKKALISRLPKAKSKMEEATKPPEAEDASLLFLNLIYYCFVAIWIALFKRNLAVNS